MAIFFTISAALVFDDWLTILFDENMRSLKKLIWGLWLLGVVLSVTSLSLDFMRISWTNPDELPLVSSDRIQYLEEWSSGHGIVEVSQYIAAQAQNHTVAVATEGSFGTLPDGILLYFHHRDVTHLRIEGIGLSIGNDLPESFRTVAKNYDQTLVVVNSHRLLATWPKNLLIAEYCRPHHAPCLQVWDVTSLIHL